MGGGAWLPWHWKRTSVVSLRSKFPWKNPDAQIHLEAMGTNQGHGEDEMNQASDNGGGNMQLETVEDLTAGSSKYLW